mmetsp:Transcript_17030/g.66361  ORF Transcript_17030/g.66361 Transcript_17030/m.66361 type:complete len:367 (+) Transcript_17030:1770-2870(+)
MVEGIQHPDQLVRKIPVVDVAVRCGRHDEVMDVVHLLELLRHDTTLVNQTAEQVLAVDGLALLLDDRRGHEGRELRQLPLRSGQLEVSQLLVEHGAREFVQLAAHGNVLLQQATRLSFQRVGLQRLLLLGCSVCEELGLEIVHLGAVLKDRLFLVLDLGHNVANDGLLVLQLHLVEEELLAELLLRVCLLALHLLREVTQLLQVLDGLAELLDGVLQVHVLLRELVDHVGGLQGDVQLLLQLLNVLLRLQDISLQLENLLLQLGQLGVLPLELLDPLVAFLLLRDREVPELHQRCGEALVVLLQLRLRLCLLCRLAFAIAHGAQRLRLRNLQLAARLLELLLSSGGGLLCHLEVELHVLHRDLEVL